MHERRILHLGKFYPPVSGGMETVLETLCQAERRYADTRALVMNRTWRTAHDVWNGVPVTRVGTVMTIGAVAVAPSLPVWLARSATDLVVLHEPNPLALVAYFLARPRGRLVVWYHSEAIRPQWRYRLFYHPFLEFALRRADRIVVASPPMMDAPPLVAHRRKCVVIPYGLELTRYTASSAVLAKADAIRRTSAAPIVLFVGRMVRYKGVDVLLRALAGLPVQAALIGDGPLRASLEAMARDLGIADRVRFLGGVSDEDRIAWYHACDLLVLPSISRQEAFGVVQLEAMVCAKPVVSTALGTGVAWVNQHESTGLVVTPGDAVALNGALKRLIEDGALRQRLGAAGRLRVQDSFTAEHMASAVRALYGEVLTSGSPLPARSASVNAEVRGSSS